jgi:hypothetical protein
MLEPESNSSTPVPSATEELVLARTVAAVTAFLPAEKTGPETDYLQYVNTRATILQVVRAGDQESPKLIGELADALIELDPELPTGVLAALRSSLKFGKVVRERKKRRELYRKVTRSLLEKLFDPLLEFKMTVKDILDAFDANGLDRQKVAQDQITKIYVMVLESLKVGEIRDRALDEFLAIYVRMKIREVTLSRQDWELNWR